jgi:stringent starvation protein B
VLNISFEATSQLQMGNEWIEFSARFSGKSHKIEVPVANVLAIYARENGQGMAFPVDSAGGEAADSEAEGDGDEASAEQAGEPAETAGAQHAAGNEQDTPAGAQSDEGEGPRPDDDGAKGGRGHLKVVK